MTTNISLAILVLIALLLIVALIILFIASLWKMFQKAGKPGWASIIPFYSGWTLSQIGGKPGWWGLLAGFSVTLHLSGPIPFGLLLGLSAVDCVVLFLWLLISIGVARNFGKSIGFGFLLGIFPYIGYPIVAFGKSRFNLTKKKETKSVVILALLIPLLLLGGGLFLYRIYSQGDHSIYTSLKTENYSNSAIKFSFEYPKVMQTDTAELTQLHAAATPNYHIPVFYAYNIAAKTTIFIAAAYYNNEPILQKFNLTSSELMSQIKNGSGSFITALNTQSNNAYVDTYGNCEKTITNNLNQTSLICMATQGSEKEIQVVGFTPQNEFHLELYMPNWFWNQHRALWAQIEKSFTYEQNS